MNLRFRIQEPVADGDGNINNQPLTPVNKTGLALSISVDGENIASIADLSLFSPPINGDTSTNNIGWILTIENTDYIKLTLDYRKSGIWQSTDVRITVSKTGYLPFDNTFVVYNYDIGNNSNQIYSNGNPITDNPEFNIILINETDNVVAGVQIKNYTNFIALRKPYTTLVYLYSIHSGQGQQNYTDGDGLVLATGNNAVITNPTGYSYSEFISVNVLPLIDNVVSDSLLLQAVNYMPASSLGVSENECNTSLTEECYNIYGNIVGSLVIDFTSLSQFYINDIVMYPFTLGQIYYQVYNNTGTLVETANYTLNVPDGTFSFNPEDYDRILSIATLGDHIVIGGFKIFGLDTENYYNADDLVVDAVYRITSNAGGADFTGCGALSNDVGTEFVYTGGTIVWGTGSVQELSPAVHCLKKETIRGCLWYKIEQTDCSNYTLFNNSFLNIKYEVYKLDANGDFVIQNTAVSISGLDSTSFSLTSDGIYQIRVVRLTDEGDEYDEALLQIIFVYCNLSACLLIKIDDLVCCNTNSNCNNDKVYDFNALIITAHTYFNMLNAEYNFNYFYTALDATKLSELRDAQQFLDKMTEYCEECESGCDKDAKCTTC